MKTLRVTSGRYTPRDGDVVVTRESGIPARYTVRQIPGVVQIRTVSRAMAVRMARSFAQKYEIDAWYSEDCSYRLLEVCRFGNETSLTAR